MNELLDAIVRLAIIVAVGLAVGAAVALAIHYRERRYK